MFWLHWMQQSRTGKMEFGVSICPITAVFNSIFYNHFFSLRNWNSSIQFTFSISCCGLNQSNLRINQCKFNRSINIIWLIDFISWLMEIDWVSNQQEILNGAEEDWSDYASELNQQAFRKLNAAGINSRMKHEMRITHQ